MSVAVYPQPQQHLAIADHCDSSARIAFFIHGQPSTQGSKIFHALYGRSGKPVMKNGRVLVVTRDDSSKLKSWRSVVSDAAREAYSGPLLTGPIRMSVTFVRPRPKNHYRTGRNAHLLRDDAPAYPHAEARHDQAHAGRRGCVDGRDLGRRLPGCSARASEGLRRQVPDRREYRGIDRPAGRDVLMRQNCSWPYEILFAVGRKTYLIRAERFADLLGYLADLEERGVLPPGGADKVTAEIMARAMEAV